MRHDGGDSQQRQAKYDRRLKQAEDRRLLVQLKAKQAALRAAHEGSNDKSQRYLLGNALLRLQKEIKDVERRLGALKSRRYFRDLSTKDDRIADRNGKRDAKTGVFSGFVQGGAPK